MVSECSHPARSYYEIRWGAALHHAGQARGRWIVRVGADDSVTVVVNHSEMGQGPYTSVPMLVAEELDADWAKVRFEAAPVAAVYNHSVYGIQLYGLTYAYSFLQDDRMEVGITAGFHTIRLHASIAPDDPTRYESQRFIIPIPLPGLTADFLLTPNFWLSINSKPRRSLS